MSRIIELPPFPAAEGETDALLAATRDSLDLFWRLVLAVAVRDEATSVHFHPWRDDLRDEYILSYVVGNTRYALVPPDPDPEFTTHLLASARRMAANHPWAGIRSWLSGGAVGHLRLVAESEESEWCVVSRGSGRLAGVEFLRLTPVSAVASSGALR